MIMMMLNDNNIIIITVIAVETSTHSYTSLQP